MKEMLLLTFACCFGAAAAYAQSKADPASWTLWRAGPIPFPNEMRPAVPEMLEAGPPVDLGRDGADLTIITPDSPGEGYDAKALKRMVELIAQRVPRATVAGASRLAPADRGRHLLVLGTAASSAMACKLLGRDAAAFTDGLKRGGYHIKPIPNPSAGGKQAILALGADDVGAWAAAQILAFAIHPHRARLGSLRNWPVKLPEGAYWAPFEARYTLDPDAVEPRSGPNPPPRRPRIPFGVRVWGSPMPALESWQRLVRALKSAGVNTVVVQSGGWVDLPNSPEVFAKSVDVAWGEGLFTILYVGNEEKAHLPAPLTRNHREVVLATKDHPGLLAWHLYNQLTAQMSAEEYGLVKEQVEWLRSVSSKPIGVEVVWGHNSVEIPADKQKLIRDLKGWGVEIIATDYAPIGGWAKEPILSRWEGRLLQLEPFGVRREAVLQAHVAFLEPTVPRREEVRNQFWWAVAGDARAYYFETAYLFTSFSVRGLLSWTLAPLPDGRFDEVRDLAAVAAQLEDVLCGSRIARPEEVAPSRVELAPSKEKVALRLRGADDGGWFALLINEDTSRAATAIVTLRDDKTAYRVSDVLARKDRGRLESSGPMRVELAPGGGACLRLTAMGAR